MKTKKIALKIHFLSGLIISQVKKFIYLYPSLSTNHTRTHRIYTLINKSFLQLFVLPALLANAAAKSI